MARESLSQGGANDGDDDYSSFPNLDYDDDDNLDDDDDDDDDEVGVLC